MQSALVCGMREKNLKYTREQKNISKFDKNSPHKFAGNWLIFG